MSRDISSLARFSLALNLVDGMLLPGWGVTSDPLEIDLLFPISRCDNQTEFSCIKILCSDSDFLM